MTRTPRLFSGWKGHSPSQVAAWTRDLLDELGHEVDETSDIFALDADAAGTGVATWHGAAAAFRSSLPYHFLLGGDFVEHPGGEGYPQPYEVTIVDPAHPVTAGVGGFAVASEQYYMHVNPNNHVLAETTFTGEHLPWLAGHRMPQAWVREWGAGRVFYHAIGHTVADLGGADVRRLTLQGIRWATRSDGPRSG